MKTLRYLTILLLGTAVVSCTCEKPQQAKNVIFLIGDGMGFGAVSSLLLSEDDSTAFEQAPVIGLSETCSADNFVTDSPAGGTALDSQELIAVLIKEKAEAYIWDKAVSCGITPSEITVEVNTDGDYPYPYRAAVTGRFTSEQQAAVTRDLEENLAIPSQRQEWYTDDG